MNDVAVMEIDKNQSIKQSNNLTVARYRLTKREQKIIIAICSQLKKNADEFETVRIKVIDMADFCQINCTDKYTAVKTAINKLMSRTLQIPKDDGGWYLTHWLQTAEYFPNGIIEYCVDNRLKPELLKLRDAYLDTPAAPLMEFRRDYSARLYFILKKMVKVGDFVYNLDFFRDRFQLGKTYQKFSNIKNGVIEPAIKELNDKADIHINHEYIKEGRTYTKIHFIVTEKAIKKIKPVSKYPVKREELDDESQAMLLRLINPDRWDLTEDVARKMIKKHGLERIEKNIQYAYQYRNGKENLGGWLVSCIQRDEAGNQEERAAIKRNEEDQAKKKAAERLESRGNVINSAEEKTAESEMEPLKEEISKFILDKILKSVLDKEPISALCQMELERHGLTVAEVMDGKL